MLAFIKRKLAADTGFARVDALDEIAAKAGAAAKGDLKKLVAELEAAAGMLEGESAKFGEAYVKLAKKAADKVRGGVSGGLVLMGRAWGYCHCVGWLWQQQPEQQQQQQNAWLYACRPRVHTTTNHHNQHNTKPTNHPTPNEQGSDFFAAERARLERIIASGGVAPSKVSEMVLKSSVLGGFLGEKKEVVVEEPEEEEEEEEEDDEEEAEEEEEEEEEVDEE